MVPNAQHSSQTQIRDLQDFLSQGPRLVYTRQLATWRAEASIMAVTCLLKPGRSPTKVRMSRIRYHRGRFQELKRAGFYTGATVLACPKHSFVKCFLFKEAYYA